MPQPVLLSVRQMLQFCQTGVTLIPTRCPQAEITCWSLLFRNQHIVSRYTQNLPLPLAHYCNWGNLVNLAFGSIMILTFLYQYLFWFPQTVYLVHSVHSLNIYLALILISQRPRSRDLFKRWMVLMCPKLRYPFFSEYQHTSVTYPVRIINEKQQLLEKQWQFIPFLCSGICKC